MATIETIHAELDRISRRERGRLIAGLVRRLGPENMELAEDVAQEALISALSLWPYQGMPDRPAAWLATVARNRAIDRLRRENREITLDAGGEPTQDHTIVDSTIEDDELRMIFLCCHAPLGVADRVALTLKMVSGFTAREVAAVLLIKEGTLGQRLARAKRRMRDEGPQLEEALSKFAIRSNLDTVLKVIYLLFDLGYAPRHGELAVRTDVALEALRLAREVADSDLTCTPDALALTALLCFQASRLHARADPAGDIVLLRDQDRSAWDQELIGMGLAYLEAARQGDRVSRYHLEAGIAAAHAAAPSFEQCNWRAIVSLYTRLEQLTDSPVVSVNACVARAMAGDPRIALDQLNAIDTRGELGGFPALYLARSEVLRILDRPRDAKADIRRAIELGHSIPVERHLTRLMEAFDQG